MTTYLDALLRVDSTLNDMYETINFDIWIRWVFFGKDALEVIMNNNVNIDWK